MKLSEFLDQQENWGDRTVVDQIFHEDYMYLRETEMLTRDEFITHMITDFASGNFQSSDQKILYENDNVVSWEHLVTAPDFKRKITLTCLKKDGKLWRQIMAFEDF